MLSGLLLLVDLTGPRAQTLAFVGRPSVGRTYSLFFGQFIPLFEYFAIGDLGNGSSRHFDTPCDRTELFEQSAETGVASDAV